MSRKFVLFAAAVLLGLAGCGGSGGPSGRGEVSGVVFDESGYVVRNARVYVGNRQVQSTSSGTYVLTDVPADDLVVRAEVYKDGTRYTGQNVARVNPAERAKNVNIALFREDQIASIEGTVRDRSDRLVTGVRLFLVPSNGALPTSATTITDSSGHFHVGGLRANLTYKVQVNALGYNSDVDTITLNPGEDRFIAFTIPDGVLTDVPTPTGLSAIAYTSPAATRGNGRLGSAIEAIKQRINPRRVKAKMATRDTSGGNPIEVDLFWNPYTDNNTSTALLGFGIYRGIGSGTLQNTDFLRDPLASFYADADRNLFEGTTYTYGITSIDTLYDPTITDGPNGESPLSNRVSVTPLGDFGLPSVNPAPQPTFSWLPLNGATGYYVYIFDRYPSINVTERYVNATPMSGTQFTYTNNLAVGQTYYYLVVATNADETAYSFSPVGSFTVR